MAEKERRFVDFGEIVIKRDGKSRLPSIEGYAAVFNRSSSNLGGFTEKIAPGAFKNALKKSDVRALFNHDPNMIFGRTGVNLSVKEDERGLHMRVDPIDTPTYRDVAANIEAKLVTQQSFGFTVAKDQWEEDKKSGAVTRTLIEIDELFDVSPVTYPAYPDTKVALRSLEEWKNGAEHEPEPEPTPEPDRLDEINRKLDVLIAGVNPCPNSPASPGVNTSDAGPIDENAEADNGWGVMNRITEKQKEYT